MTPLYKRMQGDPHRQYTERVLQDAYQQFGITHGTPGSMSENEIRGRLNAILSSNENRDNKLKLLDALHWFTVNNVEHGGVSDVLEEVDRTSEKVLYEAKK